MQKLGKDCCGHSSTRLPPDYALKAARYSHTSYRHELRGLVSSRDMIDLLLENNKKTTTENKIARISKRTYALQLCRIQQEGPHWHSPTVWALHTIAMKFWGSGDASDRRHVDIIVVPHLP